MELNPHHKDYPSEKKKKPQWNRVEHQWTEYKLPEGLNLSPNPFEDDVRAIAEEAVKVLIKKHQDYGPDNINNAPGGALNGLLVRMHDKMERLKTLIIGKKTPKYESVEDTFIDMLNYSIIALMIQRGKWPKK